LSWFTERSFDVKDWNHVSKSLEEARLIEAQSLLNASDSMPVEMLEHSREAAAIESEMAIDKPEDYQSSQEDNDEDALSTDSQDDEAVTARDDEAAATSKAGRG
jgi:hypothetical protein